MAHKETKNEPLVAIVHNGTFEGDSNYHVPGTEIEYIEGMSWEKVAETYLKKRMEEENCQDMDVSEFIEEFGYEDMCGAWILTKDQLELISLVWESDPGNDSAVYRCNYTAKCMADKACVKHLGKKPKVSKGGWF
jgi:hypothetical protein